MNSDLEKQLRLLKKNAHKLAHTSTAIKDKVLKAIATGLLNSQREIIDANKLDLQALAPDTTAAFRDRLLLNESRISQMADSLSQVVQLADPVNEVIETKTLENGLNVQRVRAPLGVLFMIFESRPNVILEAFSLAFKSGNAIILRGGSESQKTSAALYKVMDFAIKSAGLPYSPYLGILDFDRSLVERLLTRRDLIDVVVPRGGEKLIDFVQKTSHMPIIKNDRGLCHAYIDEGCDLQMALAIVVNGKTQRPGVCNSLETILVHERVAPQFLPELYEATQTVALKWFVDPPAMNILKGKARVLPAQPENWGTEYLDLIMNCRVVKDFESALGHIEEFGSRHSEVIVTQSEARAKRFLSEVDAAAVYWNASTRFTDGYQLGLGGELGISTQKLHVRGPVGLRELTTPRWIICGVGQVRT